MAKKKIERPSDYTRPDPPSHNFNMVGNNFICPRCGYVLGTCDGVRPSCYEASPEEIQSTTEQGLRTMEAILRAGDYLYE